MNYEGIACERIRMGAHNFCQSAVYGKVIVSMFSRLSYVYLTYILRISYVYPTYILRVRPYTISCVSIGKAVAKVLLFSEISKKNAKKAQKICFIQKKAVPLHAFSGGMCSVA